MPDEQVPGSQPKDDPSPPEEIEAGQPPDRQSSKIIDVKGMIRKASTRVRVEQLVRQGKKYISLLSRERIEELVNQAVKNIVDKYRAVAAGVTDMAQLQAESKEEFNELLEQYQHAAKAKGELEQSKSMLDEEVEELRQDLERQKALAEGRLSEDLEKALIVGFAEFERELDRITLKVFDRRKLILENQDDPKALAELKEVEQVLHTIIARLVGIERERFAVGGGRDREIGILELRMKKMIQQIALLEDALKTISTSKLYSNQQIQNLLRGLGLLQDDKHFEKKREMLKIILQQNLDLKKQFAELEAKQGGTA